MFCALQIVAQEMPKVAGVEFGWPYSKCKRILDNKFNGCDDSYQLEKNRLEYRNISFAGSNFDYVDFYFEANENATYLSTIRFVSGYDLDDLSSAKLQLEDLRKVYSEKYEFRWSKTDDQKLPCYVFGHNPREQEKGLVVISIEKIKNGKGDMRYWTMITYIVSGFVKLTDDI